MASSARETQRPRGAARRVALLDAALQILGEVGVEAVTHRRVAQVAGLPLASTTYWFKSKDDLLVAALELAAERDTERLHRCMADIDQAADPVTVAIDAMLPAEGLAINRARFVASYALILEAARRPALRDLARRWAQAYVDVLTPTLERAGSKRPAEDAELLFAAVDGLLVEQLAAGETDDLRPGLKRLANALLAAPR